MRIERFGVFLAGFTFEAQDVLNGLDRITEYVNEIKSPFDQQMPIKMLEQLRYHFHNKQYETISVALPVAASPAA